MSIFSGSVRGPHKIKVVSLVSLLVAGTAAAQGTTWLCDDQINSGIQLQGTRLDAGTLEFAPWSMEQSGAN